MWKRSPDNIETKQNSSLILTYLILTNPSVESHSPLDFQQGLVSRFWSFWLKMKLKSTFEVLSESADIWKQYFSCIILGVGIRHSLFCHLNMLNSNFKSNNTRCSFMTCTKEIFQRLLGGRWEEKLSTSSSSDIS